MWTENELKFLKSLNDPSKIQNFLDDISYDARYGTSSPRYVLEDKSANCFEGALFASAALELQNYKPLIVDMMAHNDDDHVIAVYKTDNHWGSIAKSNTTTLRGREPIYKSIRELVLSYFDFYFNILGEKTLRLYSSPVNLKKYCDWQTTTDDLDYIGNDLYFVKHYKVLTDSMIEKLSKAHPLVLEASLLGSKPEGLYKPN